MHSFFSIWTFLFGLVIGSFLNVCIYRLPRGQSIVTPRSYCPECGRFIHWYDNVPVFSYLLLGGRCRNCKKSIPFRYPFVELITGLFSFFVYLKFGAHLSYFFYFIFLAAPLIALTFIDLDHQIIPDVISLSGIITGIIANLFISPEPIIPTLLQSLTGILAGGGSLFLISWIYEKLRHQEGIGGGDVKLAAMLGAFFGWKGVFLILLLSSFLGSVIGIFLVLFYRKGLQLAIPYGPFLATGALLYLFFGQEIVQWYLSFTSHLYGG